MADRTAAISLADEPSFDLGVARVQPATRQYTSPRGTEILEPRVMQVLVALARSANSVVSRQELTMAAWHGIVVGEDSINRVLSRLRKLSEADGGKAFELKTIVKVGYILSSGLGGPETRAAIEESVSDPIAPPPTPVGSPARRTHVRAFWPAIWILSAAGAGMAIWFAWPGAAIDDPMPADRPVAVTATTTVPLTPEAQELSATLHDDLVVDLTAAGLTVATDDPPGPATATATATASNGATFRIATNLVPDGPGEILTVRVDHLPSKAVLWSRTWQGDLATLSRRRDEIALRMSDMLALAYDLRGHSKGFVAASLPDLFAGASGYRYQAEWPEALRHWKRLASANPTAASAWGVAAYMAGRIFLSWDQQNLPSGDKAEMQALAHQFADRALAIDRRTDHAYAALSDIASRQDYFAREAILQRGLAAMGGENKILDAYLAVLLSDTGYWKRAAPYAERALKTDPNSRENIVYAALVRSENGDPNADIALLASTMKRWPDDADFWGFMLQQQEEVGHMPVVRAMMEHPPIDAFSQAERQCLEAAIALETPGGSSPARLDMVERCFKEANLSTGFAFDALQRGGAPVRAFELMKWAAVTKRCETICLVGRTPGMGFRQQPGYWPLVERIGLVRYWRQRRRAPDFCAEPQSVAACKRAQLPDIGT